MTSSPERRARLRVALVGVAEPDFGSLALDALAAAVRTRGVVRELVDLEVLELQTFDPEAIAAQVAAASPDLVALSCYVWSAAPLLAAAARLARRDPAPIVVAGGPELAGIEAETLAREAALDAVAHGEGEETFGEVLEALATLPAGRRRAALAGIPGLSTRTADGRVTASAPREPIADLDALPSPYLDGSYFRRRSGRLEVHCAVVAQYRGCPFRCAYCHWGSGQQRLRWFGVERVTAELEAIRRAGIEDVFFADALFTLRPERARTILDVLGELRFREVTVHVDPDRLDDDLAARLATVPGIMVHVGVQSTSAETLRHARRDLAVSATPRLRRLVELGARVRPQAIVGLPTDSPAQQRATLAPFVEMPENVDVQLFQLQILPGSEYWRTGRGLGLRFDEAPPHFVERGVAWGPEDLQRMKLDAWLVEAVHDRNGFRFLDRLHRTWAADAPPLPWRVADRLWAAGELRDLPHGAWIRRDPAAVRRAQEAARAVVEDLPQARTPDGAAAAADAAALDQAIMKAQGDSRIRRWALSVHPGHPRFGAEACLGRNDTALLLRGSPGDNGLPSDTLVVCAGRDWVHVAPIEGADLDRLRTAPGRRPLGLLLDEGRPAGARTTPRPPLALRLPAAPGEAVDSRCNNGCVRCLTARAPGSGGVEGPPVRGEDVVLRDREPLMRRDLAGVVADLRRRGAASVTVVTNGRLLAYPARAKELVHAGVDRFVVKLFGCDATAHDAHTRVQGSWEQARLGIANARAAGARVAVAFPAPPGESLGSEASARGALARELTGSDPVGLPALDPPT